MAVRTVTDPKPTLQELHERMRGGEKVPRSQLDAALQRWIESDPLSAGRERARKSRRQAASQEDKPSV